MIDGALADAQSLDDLRNYVWPKIDHLDYSGLSAFCDRFADRGIAYDWADFFQRPSNARGIQNFYPQVTRIDTDFSRVLMFSKIR